MRGGEIKLMRIVNGPAVKGVRIARGEGAYFGNFLRRVTRGIAFHDSQNWFAIFARRLSSRVPSFPLLFQRDITQNYALQ